MARQQRTVCAVARALVPEREDPAVRFWYVRIACYVYTRLREAEALGLEREDVDLERWPLAMSAVYLQRSSVAQTRPGMRRRARSVMGSSTGDRSNMIPIATGLMLPWTESTRYAPTLSGKNSKNLSDTTPVAKMTLATA